MLDSETKKIGFGLSLITVINSLIGCLTSFIMLILMVHHVYYNRLKRSDIITIILCINIYINLLILLIIFIIMNLQAVLGDLYEKDFNSSWCTFVGYSMTAIYCTLYTAFVNQAFFRLCRIVYSQHRWLQFFWLYIIMAPIELILAFTLMSPLYIWHSIVYLPMEYYCYIQFSYIRDVLWTALGSYGIPLTLLSYIYIRITKFIRQQPNNPSLAIRRRQDRDLIILRRIFMTVGVLLTAGLPSVILLIIFYITGQQPPLMLRIMWLSITLALTGLSGVMILFTPQLKRIVFERYQRNRVTPFGNSVMNIAPAGTMTTQ